MDREEFTEFLILKADEIGSVLKTVGITVLCVIGIVLGAFIAIDLLGYIGGGLLCYVKEDWVVHVIQQDLKEGLSDIFLASGFGIILFFIGCVITLVYIIFFAIFTHLKNWIESNIWEAKRIVARRRAEQSKTIIAQESAI
jgi:hypothetical protein